MEGFGIDLGSFLAPFYFPSMENGGPKNSKKMTFSISLKSHAVDAGKARAAHLPTPKRRVLTQHPGGQKGTNFGPRFPVAGESTALETLHIVQARWRISSRLVWFIRS